MKHKFISSKMKKGAYLLQDPLLSKHIPVTKWYSNSTLNKMFDTYPVLYIKPDKGSSGNGIIRLKRVSSSESMISYKTTSKKYNNSQIVSEIKKRMRAGRRYLIQQGITLATYHNKPFDLRIVLQKPLKKWVLTWKSAKVASKSSSIVTNVAQGARDANLTKTLKGADQSLAVPATLKKLTTISYKIANKLGSRFPFRIIGLDMGIDKNGKVWFIEANTKPSFYGLRKVDPIQYRRYLRAKRQIEANS